MQETKVVIRFLFLLLSLLPEKKGIIKFNLNFAVDLVKTRLGPIQRDGFMGAWITFGKASVKILDISC